jgi:hypothetical protein
MLMILKQSLGNLSRSARIYAQTTMCNATTKFRFVRSKEGTYGDKSKLFKKKCSYKLQIAACLPSFDQNSTLKYLNLVRLFSYRKHTN